MNPEIEKIHSKINKLIKLKEGAEDIGSMEEAANAAAQIQKLLLKYNLDLNSIEPEKVKERIILKQTHIGKEHGYKKTESDWMLILANILSKHNMCKCITTNSRTMAQVGRVDITLIGEPGSIEIVEYLLLQLVVRIRKMRLSAYKERLRDYPDLKKNGYFRSYSKAVSAEIAIKLREQEQEITKNYSGGSQLMVINQEILDEKAKETFGQLSQAKPSKLKNMVGALDGSRDGSQMSIHQGLEDKTKYIK